MEKRKVSGFTLIELMIVVAIVAIIAAVAFPQYTQHVRKGRRAQVQAFMMDMASREQQYLTDMRQYAVDVGSTAAYTTLNVSPSTDITKYYTITTAARTGISPSFQITATAIGDQASDKQSGYTIKSLTLDDTGAKATVDSGGTSRASIAW